MLFQILLLSFLGILAGILTGLIPGLHPNTMIVILLSFSWILVDKFSPLSVSIFILSMAVTNSIVDFIPSILLGAPETDTSLGVLPGHEFLLEGRSYEAIRLTVIGGLMSLIFIIVILVGVFPYIPSFYQAIEKYIPFILISIVSLSILRSKKKFWSIIVFFLSGSFGLLILNGGIISSKFVFFPLLGGLFGLSILLNSIRNTPKIPEQNKNIFHISFGEITKGGLTGTLSGFLVGFLPGIGAAQAAFLAQQGFKADSKRKFMIAIGGVNTTNIILSIFALWLIGKPRSGAGIAIENILNLITTSNVIIFTGAVALSCGIGGIVTLILSKRLIKIFKNINYKYLCIDIIILLLTMIFLLTGIKGVLIAVLGSCIGLVAILSKSRKSFLMGSLILPTILIYLGMI